MDSTLPVVIITAMGGVDTAVTAIKEGCFDYVTKPWDNDKLLVIVGNAIKQRRLVSENAHLRRALRERYGYSNIVGKSDKILQVLDLVSQVAPSRSTVLIQGESGTGKELIAKAIHLKSTRSDKPFIAVNSGSMPVDLLESTLFGHVRGAFTSAVSAKKGLFEVADQGTIFFDEIGTIGLETQAKLLRVIQEREFMRLGGVETIKVDVRIIAATNVDLEQLVESGRFREDLYYRLNVINIQLPPLRERREDIPAHCGILHPEVLRREWQASVSHQCGSPEGADGLPLAGQCPRTGECHRAGCRSVSGRDHRPVTTAGRSAFALRRGLQGLTSFSFPKESSLFDIMDAIEKRVIIEMLERSAWSQTEAADNFHIPLSTLNQKIKRYGIEIKKKRDRTSSIHSVK